MKNGGVRTPMPTMSNPKFQLELSASYINILKNGSTPTASPRKGMGGGANYDNPRKNTYFDEHKDHQL